MMDIKTMKNIILIGGAEGTGKSTLAKQLADHFQVPWISTDQIRTISQIAEPDREKQNILVWNGVSALVHSPHPWEGFIIEGIAIKPEFIYRDLAGIENLKCFFLVQEDEELIKQVVLDRSKLPFIKTKSPNQQANKVANIIAENAMIKENAQEIKYSCILAHSNETLSMAIRVLEQ
jgi:2-phosphoglycerate kinase